MTNSTEKIEFTCYDGVEWSLRLRIPDGVGPHPVLLLLHGWTGDEDAMWVFASRLPTNWLIISPRGLYDSPHGGYGWHPYRDNQLPEVNDFELPVNALVNLLSPNCFPVEGFKDHDLEQVHLLGFSQGAALAYGIALLHPQKVGAIAGLSGFMPENAIEYIRDTPLLGKKAFVSHGTQDQLVTVEKARKSVEILKTAGADVVYCEKDVGHKLSAGCFQAMGTFFKKIAGE